MCKPSTKTTTFSINKIIKHPKFNKEDFTADLTLFKLSMRVSFNKYVRPICLPLYSVNAKTENRYRGKEAIVIGWGKTVYGGEKPSCIPKKLKIPILERAKCNGNISQTLFCAGYLNGEGDSCQVILENY